MNRGRYVLLAEMVGVPTASTNWTRQTLPISVPPAPTVGSLLRTARRNGLDPEEDFIVSAGLPFLAHRLRRASEQLVEATSFFQRNSGFTGPPRSVSTLLLLEAEGPLGITEISNRLAFSHPLIIRFVRALLEEGYVTQQSDPADARRRLIGLTDKGRRHVAFIWEFIPVLSEALRRLFEDMGVDLYSAVEKFELATAERSLVDRLQDARSPTKPR